MTVFMVQVGSAIIGLWNGLSRWVNIFRSKCSISDANSAMAGNASVDLLPTGIIHDQLSIDDAPVFGRTATIDSGKKRSGNRRKRRSRIFNRLGSEPPWGELQAASRIHYLSQQRARGLDPLG